MLSLKKILLNEKINLSIDQKNEIDNLLKIMKTQKAGQKYKIALLKLIKLAEEITGKTIMSKRQALLALDYIEPKLY